MAVIMTISNYTQSQRAFETSLIQPPPTCTYLALPRVFSFPQRENTTETFC